MLDYKGLADDLDLAKVRDVALKSCFGLVLGEPFAATLKFGHEELPVVGEFTPDAEHVAGWIRPMGDCVSRIHNWLPTVEAIINSARSANAELVFRGEGLEATLPIVFLQAKFPPMRGDSLWPRGPTIRVRAIFSDWSGNGGWWFDYATVGIQGLPMLSSNARTHKVKRIWEYPDGTEFIAGGTWTQWGGVKLAADGWHLELRGTRSEGGNSSYSYTGEIRRDDREPFPVSRLEIFLGRVELFLSVYANRRRHFEVVSASRSIQPHGDFYTRWSSYRCRIMSGSVEYHPNSALDVVRSSNEDDWVELFSEFYRCCSDPVFEEAVRKYVAAGEHLLLSPTASFVDAWGAMELLYQKFSNGRCEPGRLLSIIKKNRRALAELENPYQYVAYSNKEEKAFLDRFYQTRNDYAHGRLPEVYPMANRAQRWWAGKLKDEEDGGLMKKQPAYDLTLLRFIRLVRALMMVHLKGSKCPDTGSDDSGQDETTGNS